jgi:hypothetical protein
VPRRSQVVPGGSTIPVIAMSMTAGPLTMSPTAIASPLWTSAETEPWPRSKNTSRVPATVSPTWVEQRSSAAAPAGIAGSRRSDTSSRRAPGSSAASP